MSRIKDFFQRIIPIVTISNDGNVSVGFKLQENIRLNNVEIEEKIRKLDSIKESLFDAVKTVEFIQTDAKKQKEEYDELGKSLARIKEDKATTEEMLKVDNDLITRILIKATKSNEKRNVIISLIIGFLTGFLSGFLVYLLTK